jgi:hypothetical protein
MLWLSKISSQSFTATTPRNASTRENSWKPPIPSNRSGFRRGPLKYKKSIKAEGKAYIVLYACSLTRAIYVELLTTLSAQEFISSLKRFIARKGRPQKIFSDNGKTFVAAEKWSKTVQG